MATVPCILAATEVSLFLATFNPLVIEDFIWWTGKICFELPYNVRMSKQWDEQ